MTQIKLISTLLFVIMLVGATGASAQNDREYHSTVQVSFFPPLSTNGKHAKLYTNDFSFNVLAGFSNNERAFAFAGLTNIIRSDATGFQFAGLVNYTGGEGRAFQFAGLTNIVRGDHIGFQFGGLANISRDVDGFQFGGLFNVAHKVRGVQFAGLFNVAKKVRGVQFAGLFNVAEESDYPIGLVNIIRNGEMGVAVGYNEIGTTSLTFRSGGRVLYGILGFGYNHRALKNEWASIIAGYGAHINILSWLRINNEITAENIGIFSGGSDTFKTGYALLPAFRPAAWIEIFGGPSINFMQSTEEKMFDMFPKKSFWEKRGTTKKGDPKLQQAFVGWQVGVQFIF